jgi:diguanylate cyclase
VIILKQTLKIWKRSSTIKTLVFTLLFTLLLIIATISILEYARQNVIFSLPWGAKPNDDVIISRCTFIGFITIIVAYTNYFFQENVYISRKVKRQIIIIGWYLRTISWAALVFKFFQPVTIWKVEIIMGVFWFISTFISIFAMYLFSTIYKDISVRLENEKKLSEELFKEAITDKLTGLRNWKAFGEELFMALQSCRDKGTGLSVLFLDLDRFKYINDTLGHSTGDVLLERVAERLLALENKQRSVYRLGGDEFTFIVTNENEDIYLSESIIKSFEKPLNIEDKEIYITTSIGIARYPLAGEDVETLTKNADSAMYMAKEQGKNRFWVYTKNINHVLSEMMSLENDLRKAIKENGFFLNFQPIIDIKENSIRCFEVFIRWNHSTKGIIMPGMFIPLAEETGLIVPIGEWVLRNACLEFNKSIKKEGKNIKLAVNLSARQLQQSNLVCKIQDILKETEFDPKDLELEVTESSVMKNPEESIEKLEKLKELGISIIIDDFGVKYSSLNYLKILPINILKIDKCFIDGILKNKKDVAITKSIIQMAHSLDLIVVAEGVEAKGQYEILKTLECDRIQGYYFSKPVLAENIEKLLNMVLNV